MKTKLYFGEAVGLIAKTTPFLWVRLGSYAVLGAGLMLYFGIIGGLAWGLGKLWAPLGIFTFLAGLGGSWGIVHWVTRYYFYMLKSAHAAVMTEYIYDRKPEGSQVMYGKEQVISRFRDTSILFAVDRIVDGIVRIITRTVGNIVSILPIPGLNSLKQFLDRVAKYSTGYIDTAILTLAYRDREPNVWKVAQDGVILYAQCWKPVLTNAVALSLLSYAQFLLFLVVLGLPAIAIGAAVPALQAFLAVMVLVGAWMLKLALADAFAMAATLLAFHRSIEGMEPDPAWQARLSSMSDKFGELAAKAKTAIGAGGDGEVVPVPVIADPMAAPPPAAAGDPVAGEA
jgi:hypothetical protein